MTIRQLELVYQNREQMEQAKACSESLKELLLGKNEEHRGAFCVTIGERCLEQGLHDGAEFFFQKALVFVATVPDIPTEIMILRNVGELFLRKQQLQKAKETLRRAERLCGDESVVLRGACCAALAVVLAFEKKMEDAWKTLKKSEDLVGHHPVEKGRFLCKKGMVHALMDDWEGVERSLARAEALLPRLNKKESRELKKEMYRVQHRVSRSRIAKGMRFNKEILKAEGLRKKGLIECDQSNFDQALNDYRQALDLFRKHSCRREEGLVLTNIGQVYQRCAKFKEALTFYQRALDIHREIGNRFLEGIALGCLGRLYNVQAKFDKAKEYLLKALDVHQELGDIRNRGVCLGDLGNSHQQEGEYEKALEYYLQALQINEQVFNVREKAMTLCNVAGLYLHLGESEEALTHYHRALGIQEEIGNIRAQGIILGNLGILFFVREDFDRALQYYQRALDIQVTLGNPRLEAINLGHLGEVYLEKGDLPLAKEYFVKSIAVCDEIKSPVAGAFRDSLALIFAKEGNFEEAYRTLRIGEPIVQTLPSEYAKFLCIKGRIQVLDGCVEEAAETLMAARKMAEKLAVTKESEVYKNILRLERSLQLKMAEKE